MNIFKSICISLGMMQISHQQVILQTRGGINHLNVVSLISTLCVTETTTYANSPLSDGFSYHCVGT